MAIAPHHARVLVRHITGVERTTGRIISPDTAKKEPQEDDGVSMGTGARRLMDVRPGNNFLVGNWSGSKIEFNGENLLIMKESALSAQLHGAQGFHQDDV